jgi:hypothetical protein
LRRKADAVLLELPAAPGPPAFVVAEAVDPAALAGRYGPFSSRRAARETLRSLAGEHALCWTALGLERRSGPCFARQVRRRDDAGVGPHHKPGSATRRPRHDAQRLALRLDVAIDGRVRPDVGQIDLIREESFDDGRASIEQGRLDRHIVTQGILKIAARETDQGL